METVFIGVYIWIYSRHDNGQFLAHKIICKLKNANSIPHSGRVLGFEYYETTFNSPNVHFVTLLSEANQKPI
jgi:hypothetical protein